MWKRLNKKIAGTIIFANSEAKLGDLLESIEKKYLNDLAGIKLKGAPKTGKE